MRVVLNCSGCEANVLILDNVPEVSGRPEPAALSRIVAGRGWANVHTGVRCTDCTAKPIQPPMPKHLQGDPATTTKKARKKKAGEG